MNDIKPIADTCNYVFNNFSLTSLPWQVELKKMSFFYNLHEQMKFVKVKLAKYLTELAE